MGRWRAHTVTCDIKATLPRTWEMWNNMDAMPLWMSWIESVKTIDAPTKTLPDLTEWTLAANGFRFKWKAQINERIDRKKLEWSSIGGLPTKGCVRFFDEKENTLIDLCDKIKKNENYDDVTNLYIKKNDGITKNSISKPRE